MEVIYIVLFVTIVNIFPEVPDPSEDPKVILCFGNSITAGHGLDPEDAYPNVLSQILNQAGYNYKVINAGLSGETSPGPFQLSSLLPAKYTFPLSSVAIAYALSSQPEP